MSKTKREQVLVDVESGKTQVLINVAILTEGWDFPPISCVVLLRQSSYKSTMIQMIGRGLRTIDHKLYPNINKKDCIVLDFGISTRIHKSLEDEVNLEREELISEEEDKNKYKQECPKCEKLIPLRVRECVFCSYEFKKEKKVIHNYIYGSMKEIKMLERSKLAWMDLNLEKNQAFFSSGFNVWVCIFRNTEQWVVTVGDNRKDADMEIETQMIYRGDKYNEALKIAERFLRDYDQRFAILKDANWRNAPASEKQLKSLQPKYRRKELSKGEASALLTYQFNAQRKLQAFGLVA